MSKHTAQMGILPVQTETGNYIDAPKEAHVLLSKLLGFEEHQHIRDFNFKLILRKKASVSKGKPILARTKKFGEIDRLLHNYDFLIWMDQEWWDENGDSREPLMYSQLQHCGTDKNDNPVILDYDLKEFATVGAKYGLWNPDLKHFSEQLSLGIGDAQDQQQPKEEDAA